MKRMSLGTVRVVVAVVSVLILIALVAYSSTLNRTAKPMAINGDELGRDSGETLAAYEDRAAETLNLLSSDSELYALVTFHETLTPVEAGQLLEDIPVTRVDALIIDQAPPIALPEPTGAAHRADVFTLALERIAASSDTTVTDPRLKLRGVVIHDTKEHLVTLADDYRDIVLAVEALPPDAVWGRFGVRPVVDARS